VSFCRKTSIIISLQYPVVRAFPLFPLFIFTYDHSTREALRCSSVDPGVSRGEHPDQASVESLACVLARCSQGAVPSSDDRCAEGHPGVATTPLPRAGLWPFPGHLTASTLKLWCTAGAAQGACFAAPEEDETAKACRHDDVGQVQGVTEMQRQ